MLKHENTRIGPYVAEKRKVGAEATKKPRKKHKADKMKDIMFFFLLLHAMTPDQMLNA